MENRISYYILSLLHLNGSVKIPGLGRLIQQRQPAKQDASAATLKAPSARTQFSLEEGAADALLEKYVAYQTRQSRAKARMEIVRFARDARAQAEEQGHFTAPLLGRLEKQNADLTWVPNTTYTDPGTQLPEVRFVPRQGFPLEDPKSAAQSSPREVPQPVQFVDIPSPPARVLPASPPPVAEQPAPAAHTTPPPSTQKPVQKPAEPRLAPQHARITRVKKEREWIGPVLAFGLLGLAVLAFFIFTGGTDKKSTDIVDDNQGSVPTDVRHERPSEEEQKTTMALADSGIKSQIANTPTGVAQPEVEAPGTDTGTPVIDSTPSPDRAVSREDCLVVVGAFSRTVNADRMQQRLLSMGFEVHTIQVGNFARIGVPADCADEAVVRQLRSQVEPSAWVLRPE